MKHNLCDGMNSNEQLHLGTSQLEGSSTDCDTNITVENHETDLQELRKGK